MVARVSLSTAKAHTYDASAREILVYDKVGQEQKVDYQIEEKAEKEGGMRTEGSVSAIRYTAFCQQQLPVPVPAPVTDHLLS